jgi:hypothetical protein
VNLPIDGRLTQGENIADNGGLKQAFRVNFQFIGFGLKQPFREKSFKYFLVKLRILKHFKYGIILLNFCNLFSIFEYAKENL